MNTSPPTYVNHVPQRPPRLRQAEAFNLSADEPIFAIFMEQRTGKSKVVLDTVAYQYEEGNIDALLIIAMPNSVPYNWINDEIPADLPSRIPRQCYLWRAQKAAQVGEQALQQSLLNTKGLAILAVNGEAIISVTFRKYAAKFLKARRVFVVADETTLLMKAPKNKRSRVINNIGKRARYKRILDGTPVGEGPLDLYSQMRFLSPSIMGHDTFASFKSHFAEWEEKTTLDGQQYKVLKRYLNLDELQTRIQPYVFRCLRSECFDLPAKLYSKRYFDLSPEQRRVYEDLKTQYAAELRDRSQVTARNVLARYLRLQQITSNYWPPTTTATDCPTCGANDPDCDHCDGLGVILQTAESPLEIDQHQNPRLLALESCLQETSEPVIVWARFDRDVDNILALAESLQRRAARYDGHTTEPEKALVRKAFQQGQIDVLVAKQRSAGRGIKLSAARTLIYYSNEYSLLSRLQSEDRAEGDEQIKTGTHIIDIVATDTNDQNIVQALRDKKKLADLITGDPDRSWL